MQCPHCAHPDSIRYGPVVVSNATVAKPADGSFKHYDEAKIQPLSNRPVSSILKGWGCERSAGFSGSVNVVKMEFMLDKPVEPRLYKYLHATT